MTIEHKLAWALRAAADDENARFTCKQNKNTFEIFTVLSTPDWDWQLVKAPVVTHEYYYLNAVGHYARTELDGDKIWTMHITITDGKRVAGFRE